MKNILGYELKTCNTNNNYKLSDSSINGYCYENGGGYHNICINMNPYISNNFSTITGQSNWSKDKIGKNHCICQGAWANYVSRVGKLPNNILKCDAIPEEVLTDYFNNFKKWNNITVKNQHIKAFNELRNQCPNMIIPK